MLSMHELSLPEPMLGLSVLILATCLEHAQKFSEHCVRHVHNVPETQEQYSRPTQEVVLWAMTPFHAGEVAS